MAKKKQAKLGTGNVTAVQVAFMVEHYLRTNQFAKTLTEFRKEAASLLNPNKSVPKNVLSLDFILEEYINLKSQHIAVSQEKNRMAQMMQGLHDTIHNYSTSGLFSPLQCRSAAPSIMHNQTNVATPVAYNCAMLPSSTPSASTPQTAEIQRTQVGKRTFISRGQENNAPSKRPRIDTGNPRPYVSAPVCNSERIRTNKSSGGMQPKTPPAQLVSQALPKGGCSAEPFAKHSLEQRNVEDLVKVPKTSINARTQRGHISATSCEASDCFVVGEEFSRKPVPRKVEPGKQLSSKGRLLDFGHQDSGSEGSYSKENGTADESSSQSDSDNCLPELDFLESSAGFCPLDDILEDFDGTTFVELMRDMLCDEVCEPDLLPPPDDTANQNDMNQRTLLGHTEIAAEMIRIEALTPCPLSEKNINCGGPMSSPSKSGNKSLSVSRRVDKENVPVQQTAT